MYILEDESHWKYNKKSLYKNERDMKEDMCGCSIIVFFLRESFSKCGGGGGVGKCFFETLMSVYLS